MMRPPARLAGGASVAGASKDTGSVGSELLDLWEGVSNTGAGVSVNAFTAMQAVAVMACTSILAEDFAKLPCRVVQHLPKGGKRLAKEHPLYPLLRKPNDWQTWFEYAEMMDAALILRGNAYAVKVRDGRARVVQKVPIHPDRVVLWEAPDGDWFYFVTRNGLHELAVLKDEPIMIPSADVFHLRWMSSWNSLIGLSRIGLMRESIGLSIAQTNQAARLAGNGARPGGILSTPQKLSQDVIDRLRSQWEQTYGGWRNTGKTAILEQDLKWQALGMTSTDAQFLESRKFQTEEIGRMFRVPLHKLGVMEARTTGTSLVQMDQEYLNSVLSSYCDRWKARLERDFDIDGEEYAVEFDYSHFLKADIQTRLAALRTGVVSMIYTPNEARAAEGLPDIEGGDALYQPTNVAPIGFTPGGNETGPGSDVTGAPAPGGDGDPAASGDQAPSN